MIHICSKNLKHYFLGIFNISEITKLCYGNIVMVGASIYSQVCMTLCLGLVLLRREQIK